MEHLSQERADELISYNADTGSFVWLSGVKKGKKAGSKTVKGKYLSIGIDRHVYYAHRLAWLMYYGRFPDGQIDHINGNGLDNRIENLRDVSQKENLRNCRHQSNNTSGAMGVEWNPLNKNWRARIKVDGRTVSLGSYKSIEDAKKARKEAEATYGFHENHGQGGAS